MGRLKIVAGLLGLAGLLHAQGMIPKSPEKATVVQGQIGIREKVPETLAVTQADGQIRALLSYKTPLDVMVLMFLSEPCQADQPFWKEIGHMSARYAGWKVAWLVINTRGDDVGKNLSERFARKSMNVTVVQDPDHTVAKTLGVVQTPTFVLLDESGFMQYRGPVAQANKALSAMIGYVDPVPEPEPPLGEGCPL